MNNVTASDVSGREFRRGNRQLTTGDTDSSVETAVLTEHSDMQTDSACQNSNSINVNHGK